MVTGLDSDGVSLGVFPAKASDVTSVSNIVYTLIFEICMAGKLARTIVLRQCNAADFRYKKQQIGKISGTKPLVLQCGAATTRRLS